jgi:IDEAL domain
MDTINHSPVEVGDWVKGKTKNGELIYGYIEAVNSLQGTVKIKVMDCDNEQIIGKTVETLKHWVKKLPMSTFDGEEPIKALIDLALLTKDESWFMELSAKLKSIRQVAKESERKNTAHPSKNRLGTCGMRDE